MDFHRTDTFIESKVKKSTKKGAKYPCFANNAYLCKLYINIIGTMTTGNMIRFVCILLLWVGLCWILISRAAKIDFMLVFTIVASGIIVFVPLYKKYVRKKS